jgi:antitoxin component YwqK of YwqJK toxin-antitoxin module
MSYTLTKNGIRISKFFAVTATMIGYKAAKVGQTRVLITLDIPEDAITNVARTSVVVKETAKYRTNKAKVLKIEDEDGKEYNEAVTGFYKEKSLTYRLNELVEVSNYDMNLEEVCSTGIHFFLTKRVAELYSSGAIETGFYQSWHENGEKFEECTYVNGKLEGSYQTWYANGQKDIECTYVNGTLNGLYQSWHENGEKWVECTYVNGKLEGSYQTWYANGQKDIECTYVNGTLNGLYQRWYANGQKEVESTYVTGKLEGLYQTWYDNGEKKEKCTYVNGWRDGLYQSWHANGQKGVECTYVNGALNGLYQHWNSNGQKYKECTYVNGKETS